ncbi:MmcQ/YjbR family DNA-binding protein [Levilactobacillus tujiorum]|uniref:MmcQ/YjbR family DNA-binding protein n=1 Tax=Levilactobacillus tujiorum TaxID=2912243 RepID=UPI0014578001|nr:MmcQ/YjbR family DNA-binding protein [Levilactobacillus tujiorum]NLR31005.1 MmcQ/YjbR family DNA-binding protein [Levilactobacillus tujiorum]
MATRQTVIDYITNNYAAEPVYTFKKFPDYATFKTPQGKWFGLLMNVPQSKLGLPGTAEIDVIDLKVDPELAGILRQKPGYLPAYHMNKEHWLTVLLNEQTDDATLKQLIDDSYNTVN